MALQLKWFEKFQNTQFWPFRISSTLFGPKCFKKNSECPILAKISHSEFLPAFLHQNGLNKFGTPNFGHSKFLPVFCTKMVLKILESPILAKIVDSNFFKKNYFVQTDWEKIGMANFGQNCAF